MCVIQHAYKLVIFKKNESYISYLYYTFVIHELKQYKSSMQSILWFEKGEKEEQTNTDATLNFVFALEDWMLASRKDKVDARIVIISFCPVLHHGPRILLSTRNHILLENST